MITEAARTVAIGYDMTIKINGCNGGGGCLKLNVLQQRECRIRMNVLLSGNVQEYRADFIHLSRFPIFIFIIRL